MNTYCFPGVEWDEIPQRVAGRWRRTSQPALGPGLSSILLLQKHSYFFRGHTYFPFTPPYSLTTYSTPKIKYLTVSIVPLSICHEVMGPDAIQFSECWALGQLFHSPLSSDHLLIQLRSLLMKCQLPIGPSSCHQPVTKPSLLLQNFHWISLCPAVTNSPFFPALFIF